MASKIGMEKPKSPTQKTAGPKDPIDREQERMDEDAASMMWLLGKVRSQSQAVTEEQTKLLDAVFESAMCRHGRGASFGIAVRRVKESLRSEKSAAKVRHPEL